MRLPAPLHLTLWIALLLPGAAGADLFGRPQRGGRATGQAGAFVARADDPAAVAYNPAAIVRLEGFELLAGLDFEAPTDGHASSSGTYSATHTIQFPPALYATWRPAGASWALGGGIDAPLWRLTDWDNALYAGRFTARRSEATLFAVRAIAAYALDPRWSVGGGLRYLTGTLGYGDTRRADETGAAGPTAFEVDRLAEASADGLGFDLAMHYLGEGWGFGATWSSAVEVNGSGDLTYLVRDLGALPEDVQGAARSRFRTGRSELAEELPATLTAGAWYAPFAHLRLELDVAMARWSAARFRASHEQDVVGPGFAIDRRDRWDDTLSIRLGVEGDLSDSGWKLGGGLALEPSPAGGAASEPGAARGDAIVYAIGATYDLDERLSFDLGYSFHDFDSLSASGQEEDPAIRSTYAARAQVWSVSARWRL